jgi:alanyl-tRNA synthetase
MRVIADHARTTAFMIAEGIMPDRTGREYVLRRVMRRAIRHGHRLGIAQPFLHQVALKVVDLMGEQYPELCQRRDMIASVSEGEEVRFRQTIERGLGLLDERFEAMERENQKVLAGADAFQLYDTYGFPLDLTEVICAERGLSVDEKGYKAALAEAKERSEFKGVEQAVEAVYRQVLELVPSGSVRFTGYERDSDEAAVIALVKGGGLVEIVEAGDLVEIVADRTPFYAESGGQIGDQGVITTASARIVIEDTLKPLGGVVVHRGRVQSGSLRTGETAELAVDTARRERTRRNHSATHLLHWALRKVVGAHAQQKGSLVGPDRFRFDFTHGKALTAEESKPLMGSVTERPSF